MSVPRLCTYREDLLGPIVEFWNREFADRRNFFPIDEEIFRQRVVAKHYGVEGFDSQGFFVALVGDELAGIAHAGIWSESICRLRDPQWAGGDEGYLALICVSRQHRRQGIGHALMAAVHDFWGDCEHLTIDTQCLSPFYGNSDGVYTPFWGTPEGIGTRWDDRETLGFLERQGFVPSRRATSYVLRLLTSDPGGASAAVRQNMALISLNNEHLVIGKGPDARQVFPQQNLFDCLGCVIDDKVVGLISTYCMRELGSDRRAIYDFEVALGFRGLGIGTTLLREAIQHMRQAGAEACEAVTLDDGAGRLYEKAGFTSVAEWAIF